MVLCCLLLRTFAVCMRILEMSNYQYARSNYSRSLQREVD